MQKDNNQIKRSLCKGKFIAGPNRCNGTKVRRYNLYMQWFLSKK